MLTNEEYLSLSDELKKLFLKSVLNSVANHIIKKDLFDHTSLESEVDPDKLNEAIVDGAIHNIVFKYSVDGQE